MKQIAIVGGGSWGTALAAVLARQSLRRHVKLWVRDAVLCEQMRKRRVNGVYLPGQKIPRNVEVTPDLARALGGAEMVVGAMPSAHAREMYSRMLPYLDSGKVLVSATKGLEAERRLRMSEVIGEVLGRKFEPRVAVLSGPSFAREVARGDPTAVVIASADGETAREVQAEFSGPTLRLYTNDDMIGTELGGAVKNVIAIAAGVCVGLGLGHNTLAALVTRGLVEMTRLAVAMGGRRETLMGLAGLGDLVLTCTGALSRNRTVGVELGKGRKLERILAGKRMVAEGVGTTRVALELARQAGVEMPITEQMEAVLYRGRAPRKAIRELMERRPRAEE